MTDRPPRRFGPGNGGQGNNHFRDSLTQGGTGPVVETYQKVIAATDSIAKREWWRAVKVLPIAFEPHRIFVSKKNTAISRPGEIWCRIEYVGVRWQNGVWLDRAQGRVWVSEPRTKDDFSCVHFDSMHDRMDFNEWLGIVWQHAFVDSGGALPYKKGHASSSDLYYAVDADGKILPNERGEYPWTGWEKSYLADGRRAVGAVPTRVAPPPVLGDRERGEGGDADGLGADRRTEPDAPTRDDGGVVGPTDAGPDRCAGTDEGHRDLPDGGQEGGDEAGGGGA